MAQPTPSPSRADGGPVGVVVSHGFTGTPASMRPWAEHLAAAGYTVRLPLLPGHGAHLARRPTGPAGRSGTPTIEARLRELRARCDTVFAVGLSMGGTLVTRLAEQHPDGVAGLVLVNPAYGTRPLRRQVRALHRAGPSAPARPSAATSRSPASVEPADDRTPVVAFASLQKLWKVTRRRPRRGPRADPAVPHRVEDHVVDDLSAQLLKAGAVNTTVARGHARGQLPRRHPRQRRPDDLRRQRRVHPVADRGAPRHWAAQRREAAATDAGVRRQPEPARGRTTACAPRPTSRSPTSSPRSARTC